MAEVKSLNKAMDILDILAVSRDGISLSMLSERLGFPKSTVHAILSTMRDRGVVRQQPDGRYALGLKLFEYGCAVSRGMDVTRIARPYLERLAENTGFGAVISMLDVGSVVSFDYTTASQGVQIMPELGSRLPLHCTSQGKLLLSLMTDSAAQKLLANTALTAYTPHSVTDPVKLLILLGDIRQAGYAVEDGEYKIGLRSVSAPVYDAAGEAKYALTTIGFFRRRDSGDFLSAIDATVGEAMSLSRALGYQT